MARNVFVSFAQADRAYVLGLAEELRAKTNVGVTWAEQLAMQGPDEIRRAVRDAIKSASLLVVVVSPDGLASNWVNFETGVAAGLGIPILPVLIRGAPASLPLLDELPTVDGRRQELTAVAIQIAREIGHLYPERSAPRARRPQPLRRGDKYLVEFSNSVDSLHLATVAVAWAATPGAVLPQPQSASVAPGTIANFRGVVPDEPRVRGMHIAVDFQQEGSGELVITRSDGASERKVFLGSDVWFVEVEPE